MFKNLKFGLLLTMLLIGVNLKPAHAYLDPGTGAMILQIVLGGIAGALMVGKLYWHKIKVKLGLHKPETEAQAEKIKPASGINE
ncbi:MAG: hypothetical protein ACTSU8_02500 [Alphaproteobacteria bacterium]